MKVFYLYAHPNPNSFNSALLQRAMQASRSCGHEVRVSDLYAMNFNPVASAADFKTRRFESSLQYDREQKHAVATNGLCDDIMQEIEKLLWCDLLVLQFPLWWYTVPAIMKGWFDRTFANGLIYGPAGRFDKGGMRGRKAMISMTTGCFPDMVGSGGVMGHIDAVLWQLQYGTLAYVGFDVLEPFIAWSTRYADDALRHAYLDQIANRMTAIDTVASIPLHLTEEFDERGRLRSEVIPRTIGHRPFER